MTCVHIAVIYSVIDSMIDSVIADGGGEVAVTAATKAEVELEGIEAKEPKGDGGGDGAQWQQGDGGAGVGAEEGRRGAPRSVGKKQAASACISTLNCATGRHWLCYGATCCVASGGKWYK